MGDHGGAGANDGRDDASVGEVAGNYRIRWHFLRRVVDDKNWPHPAAAWSVGAWICIFI